MARSLRRNAPLHMEVLEDRSVPAVISGYVFNDLNGNGLRDAGEQAIANNLIELRNNTGGLVGSTTTDSNGFYNFDADSSISTAPQSVIQNITFADANTNTIRTQSINKFDSSLGTLQAVEIRMNGKIVSTIRLENLDDESAAVNGSVSGNLLLSAAGFNLNVNTTGNAAISQSLGAYDGTTDYAGRSGIALSNRTATGSNTQTLTGSAMNAFVGTGTLDLSFLAQATTQASGGGNLMANIANLGGASVTITYKYLNSTSLKPGNYTIIQKNQPAGLLDGRDSQAGVIVANSFNTDSLFVALGSTDSVSNNFGEYAPAKLNGYVYHDANNNGIRETTEKVFANINVTLTGTNDKGQAVSVAGKTDAKGQYNFSGLRPGQYTITQKDQPKGTTAGKITVGSEGGVTGATRAISSIALAVGVNGADYNFAQLAPQPPAGGGGVGKGNLLIPVNPTPQPPSPVVVPPPPPASVGKGNLLTTPTAPFNTPAQQPSATRAQPASATSVGKGNLLTVPRTTTVKPPSAVTPAAPAQPSSVGKGNLLTKVVPQPPLPLTPPRPASAGKSSLLVRRT
jgi:hypothetical protein